MANKGYDGASIGDIARAAGLAPGLVHYHFRSKLEVLLALLDDLAERHRTRLDGALKAAGRPAAARVAAFIDFHLSMRAADPEALACWITLGAEALRQGRVRARYRTVVERWVASLSEIIAEGRKERVFGKVDPAAAACALVAAIQGYFQLAGVDRTLVPRGSAADAVRAMAQGLLRAGRPLPPVRLQEET